VIFHIISGENKHILHMLQNQEQVLEQLKDFLKRIQTQHALKPITFNCMPHEEYQSESYFTNIKRSTDSRDWNPEPPTSIGLYHAYVKTRSRDVLTHKLFIISSGGCAVLANEFYNLFFDCKDYVSAGTLVESSEHWFLSQVSHRNAARVLHLAAQDFDLR
jgi:hypothetical protein